MPPNQLARIESQTPQFNYLYLGFETIDSIICTHVLGPLIQLGFCSSGVPKPAFFLWICKSLWKKVSSSLITVFSKTNLLNLFQDIFQNVESFPRHGGIFSKTWGYLFQEIASKTDPFPRSILVKHNAASIHKVEPC